ncbi:MAG: ELMO domain-containing protein, partial [archaeon]|nr:ELMO domain-containing protein [archaeon]
TLTKIFKSRNKLLKYKKNLIKIYQENIDLNKEEHKELLLSIWKHFKKDKTNNEVPEINLVDPKWCKYFYLNYSLVDIGFQGKDPLTDFRSTGLLGLKHLSLFSVSDLRADLIYKVATKQETWYFYAATSINITGKVIEFIEDGNCDKFLYEVKERINIFDFSYKLYGDFFSGFNKLWVELKYNDFMKVNTLLEEFMKTKAKEIYDKVLNGPKFY